MEVKKSQIIMLLVSFIIILTAAGCSSDGDTYEAGTKEKTPFEEYCMISERLNEFSTVQAQLTTAFFVNNGNESLQLNMVSEIKQSGNGIVGADIEMITTTRYLDETVEMYSYYTDGYFYTDYEGQKVKYKLSNEDMMEENNLTLPIISEESLKDISAETDDRGSRVVTLVADSDVIRKSLDRYAEQLIQAENGYFKCSDLTVVVKADEKGNIISCDSLISMSVTDKGVTTEYTVDTYTEYFNINEKLEIEFPDFSEYTEIKAE
ncbi:MAG: hypothetical protein Q4C14_07805 [Bacillota bacterium]|nr:hypothetical protein [Bacillota bacterium]